MMMKKEASYRSNKRNKMRDCEEKYATISPLI